MDFKNSIEKFIEIFNRSNLSISKFASLIDKDRRTITSWIDRVSNVEISNDIKTKICKEFRYPEYIWEDACSGDEFLKSITSIPQKEVRIIDEDYKGRLQYIIEHEKNRRFVIQAQFPGPMYRDSAVRKVYKTTNSSEIEELKQERINQMLRYDYDTTEWYSIKSVLSFCFASIGNFFTREEKIKVLELMHELFNNNYNKKLFLFDILVVFLLTSCQFSSKKVISDITKTVTPTLISDSAETIVPRSFREIFRFSDPRNVLLSTARCWTFRRTRWRSRWSPASR